MFQRAGIHVVDDRMVGQSGCHGQPSSTTPCNPTPLCSTPSLRIWAEVMNDIGFLVDAGANEYR